jgi:hypothetical protein
VIILDRGTQIRFLSGKTKAMGVPPIAKATLQAALINAGSNVLAQGIKTYRADVSFFFVYFVGMF